MGLTREEKKKRTKKAILQAAMQLFGANGYESTSIEQLAKAAGVGKGTVYSYFSTKRDILYAFCEDELEYIHEQLATKTNQNATILEQMMTIFMAEFHYVMQNQEFGRLFMQEMIFPKFTSRDEYKDKENAYFAMIFPIIVRAQEKGELRPELEPLHICGHFFSVFLLLVHAYYTGLIEYDEAEDALRILFSQILQGLATEQFSPTNQEEELP